MTVAYAFIVIRSLSHISSFAVFAIDLPVTCDISYLWLRNGITLTETLVSDPFVFVRSSPLTRCLLLCNAQPTVLLSVAGAVNGVGVRTARRSDAVVGSRTTVATVAGSFSEFNCQHVNRRSERTRQRDRRRTAPVALFNHAFCTIAQVFGTYSLLNTSC